MSRGERVVAVAAVVVVATFLTLALSPVPGPWLSLGSLSGSLTATVLGMRTSGRLERERQDAFAERIRRIREGEIGPDELSR